MAVRANWKGHLRFGEISCPVALYTGASTAERISFATINRATGHRVKRHFIDPSTGDAVERGDQVKGFEIDKDTYLQIDPEEVAAAIPDSTKLLAVKSFIPCSEIDTVYFDKPYYLAPAGPVGADAFAVIREALRQSEVGALATAVLFRRYRSLIIRAQGDGLVAHTLHFDYEVRSASAAFEDMPKMKIGKEMLDLAKHIIKTKTGTFDPATFDDRYESAVAEMVKAKLAGKPVKQAAKKSEPKKIDLLAALRASAGEQKTTARKPAAKRASRKKAA